jgi:hypothetical protein
VKVQKVNGGLHPRKQVHQQQGQERALPPEKPHQFKRCWRERSIEMGGGVMSAHVARITHVRWMCMHMHQGCVGAWGCFSLVGMTHIYEDNDSNPPPPPFSQRPTFGLPVTV